MTADLCQRTQGCASRTVHLNDAQEAQLNREIGRYISKGADAWGKLSPCSTFAADAWYAATGETLSPYLGQYMSDPLALRTSIIVANGGFTHSTSALDAATTK